VLGVPSGAIGFCGRLAFGLLALLAQRCWASAIFAGYLSTHDGHVPPGKPPPPAAALDQGLFAVLFATASALTVYAAFRQPT